MTTPYDVPASNLIKRIGIKLKENEYMKPPQWNNFVKTGVHKELPPVENDWWFIRGASVLRTIYMKGPIGIERMSSIYGGKQNRGSKPYIKVKGSGSIIRKLAQQLEKCGYLESTKSGRSISSLGRSFMDNTSFEIKKELLDEYPNLSQY